jgi:ribosomal protein S18 acetylase RimI-like enzyme
MDDKLPDTMIIYRLAQSVDGDAIAALHTQSWRRTYRGILRDEYLDGDIVGERYAVWQKRLTEPAANQRILVAESDRHLRGFICLFLDEDPQLGTLIDNLHVVSASKGQGIGAGLMREATRLFVPQASLPGFYLDVYEANQSAIQFYKRMGGTNVGREEHDNPGGGRAMTLRYAWKATTDLL